MLSYTLITRYEHYHASAAPFLPSRSTLCHPFLPCDIFAVLTSDLSKPEMCYSAVALSITAGCRMAPRGVTLQGPNTTTGCRMAPRGVTLLGPNTTAGCRMAPRGVTHLGPNTTAGCRMAPRGVTLLGPNTTAGCRVAPRGVTLLGPNTTFASINHWSGTFPRSSAAPTTHTVNVLLFMFIPHCIVNLSRQLTKNSPQFLVAILVLFLLPGGCLSDQLSRG